MSPVRRAAVVLSAVLLAWPIRVTLAQGGPIIVPPTPPVAEPAGRIDEADFVLATDSRLAVKLEAAAEYIHDQEWDRAARVLQQLLDLDGDPTVVIGGDKQPRTVSARAEAQRLLASLPPEGRKEYRELIGPRAAEALKEAVKDKDDEKMASVVRRFLYTDAGPEALEALAGLHDDAGRLRLAALSYQRLLELREAAKWSPESLFRAAGAFRRVGDKAHADVAAKQLLDRMGDNELVIGDRKLSRDEVQKELSKPVEANTDWPMFGGDPGRSAQGDGGMPFLWREWEYDTTIPFGDSISPFNEDFSRKLEDLFKKASDRLQQAHQPLLSSQFPVAASVTLRKDGKKHPVVVYVIHSGVTVRDLTGGKAIGMASTDGSLEWMMSDQSRENVLKQWTQAYIDQGQRPGVVFENTVIGTLSIDGDFAYAVEDLAVPPPPGGNALANPKGLTWGDQDAISHNRLMAYDLSAGCKGLWPKEVFTDPKSELADSIFLGPPLPLDGQLFVLAERDRNLRLLCLENVPGEVKGNRNPRVVYVLPLGTVPAELSAAVFPRRIHAAPLAYGDGVLVCPTHAGCVVGVDLLTRSIAWVHRYERADPRALPPGARIFPGGLVIGPNGQQLFPSWSRQGWRPSAPVVSDGAVVFAAPDGVALICLDLKTGALRWKEARQDDDLYFAGVFDGRALVVGKQACRAFNLSDGKPAWTLTTGVPSGRGAAAGGVYYLPLRETESSKEPEVCAIDVAKGRIVGHARRQVPGGHNAGREPFGNLVFAEGVVISQTTENLTVYPLLKTKLDEMNETLRKNPDDSQGLCDRAELRLEQGNAAGAVEDLHKIIDQKPAAELLKRTHNVLYPALTQLLQTDFAKGEKYLPEYDELCHVSNDAAETLRRRAGLYLLVGRGFEGEGKLKEALNAYAELAGLGDEPLLLIPDDSSQRVSPSASGRAAISELLKKAPADKRKELEEEVRRVLDKAKESKGDQDLRSFIASFGSVTDAYHAFTSERRIVLEKPTPAGQNHSRPPAAA